MSRREQPNWIALIVSLVYMICFLALPYYRLYLVKMSGWTLLSTNAVMCLPLVLGLVMALVVLLFSPRAGIAVAAATAVANFILMLTGKPVLSPTDIIQQNVATLISQAANLIQPVTLQVHIGVGAILSLLLAVVVIVLEILAMTPKKTYKPIDNAGFDF